MSDIKLFRIAGTETQELKGESAALEKTLQTLIEQNLEALLGIRFVATEYSTGKKHGGRIDTLGIDENGCPVIIEYKKALNENVINQGLFYLDWLMDHQAEFHLRVIERIGQPTADSIDWTSPRLLCIAADFTKYDVHAVQQINRNIELIRYRRFGQDLLLLELVNATFTEQKGKPAQESGEPEPGTKDELDVPGPMLDLFEATKAFLFALGDDVQMRILKHYVIFKRLKNFISVVTHSKYLTLILKVDPDTVELEEGFTRDIRGIGHWGVGDLSVTLSSMDDLERAKPLIIRSYEVN